MQSSFFSLEGPFETAGCAGRAMYAQERAAGGTDPSAGLLLQEKGHAPLPNFLQVFQGAHAVICPVPPVQLAQPFAGKLRAAPAEGLRGRPPHADSDAAFAAVRGQIAAALPASAAGLAVALVGVTRGAVHTAGGDQVSLHGQLL